VLLQVQSLAEMGAPVKRSLQLSLLESAAADATETTEDVVEAEPARVPSGSDAAAS